MIARRLFPTTTPIRSRLNASAQAALRRTLQFGRQPPAPRDHLRDTNPRQDRDQRSVRDPLSILLVVALLAPESKGPFEGGTLERLRR
jgi:hypothetical protein